MSNRRSARHQSQHARKSPRGQPVSDRQRRTRHTTNAYAWNNSQPGFGLDALVLICGEALCSLSAKLANGIIVGLKFHGVHRNMSSLACKLFNASSKYSGTDSVKSVSPELCDCLDWTRTFKQFQEFKHLQTPTRHVIVGQ